MNALEVFNQITLKDDALFTIEVVDTDRFSLGYLNVEDLWTPREEWSLNPRPLRGWMSAKGAELTWLEYRGLQHPEDLVGLVAVIHRVEQSQ